MKRIDLPSPGITLINAGGSRVESLRLVGSRIDAVDCNPVAGDLVIDLHGDRLLPGLINAHDHLQLNTLPPLESRRRYAHARQWICDVDLRRQTDTSFADLVARPRNDRLLIGGVKNLLSGVTTVAHHDPLYPFLLDARFPVRVVTHGGWSHSLYIDGEEKVRNSYLRTPPDCPWIIHAAEGTDNEAARELGRLHELGCLRHNTLIVHGIALDDEQRARLELATAGLVWCPSSNLLLFGRTVRVEELVERGRAALGTDSRLSGSRDLLAELRVAHEYSLLNEAALESIVTHQSAALLRLHDRGALRPGLLADLIVLPAGMPLWEASRADIRLVTIGGRPRYADATYARNLDSLALWAEVRVDGRPKMIDSELAGALAMAKVDEPGLNVTSVTGRAA
jgi:cytosine/adenosine deaminase-related metal-dependent hydrolase